VEPLSKMLVEKIIQHDVEKHKEHLELNAHDIVALPCLIVEAKERLRHIVDNHWYIRGDEEEPGDADQLVKVVLGFDGVGKRVFCRMLCLTARRIRQFRPTKTRTPRMSSRKVWRIWRALPTGLNENLVRSIVFCEQEKFDVQLMVFFGG